MPTRSTVRGLLTALAVLGLVSGCGTASAPSPPAGVDELVIPTPSTDPDDFVATVDNPWFPLERGSTRTYQVTDDRGAHRLVVRVGAGPAIGGVATTATVATERGTMVTDWYAQDSAGNVWWFGRAGEWRAGDDGAEAGLAMAATPRVGDGYRTAYAAGVSEDVATVESLVDDELTVTLTSVLSPGSTRRATYDRGTGLVEEIGPTRTQRLD